MGCTLYQLSQGQLRSFPFGHTFSLATHPWHQNMTSLWHEGNPFVLSGNNRSLYFAFPLVFETSFVSDQTSQPYLSMRQGGVQGCPRMRHRRQLWQGRQFTVSQSIKPSSHSLALGCCWCCNDLYAKTINDPHKVYILRCQNKQHQQSFILSTLTWALISRPCFTFPLQWISHYFCHPLDSFLDASSSLLSSFFWFF